MENNGKAQPLPASRPEVPKPKPKPTHQTVTSTRYNELLRVIEELGKDVKPTYAGSKNAAERLRKAPEGHNTPLLHPTKFSYDDNNSSSEMVKDRDNQSTASLLLGATAVLYLITEYFTRELWFAIAFWKPKEMPGSKDQNIGDYYLNGTMTTIAMRNGKWFSDYNFMEI